MEQEVCWVLGAGWWYSSNSLTGVGIWTASSRGARTVESFLQHYHFMNIEPAFLLSVLPQEAHRMAYLALKKFDRINILQCSDVNNHQKATRITGEEEVRTHLK